MREILFRGKRCDNGEWVQGYYIRADHHWHKHGIHKDWITLGASANGGWFALHNKYAVKPETVGQYTGLTDKTDKNGKKIFEGDILKTKYGRLCTVVWFSSQVYNGWDLMPICTCNNLAYTKPPTAVDLYMADNLEVIGNIHDNPELVDGGDAG